MNKSQYNPEKHHRRSIRLKGHDYAGGGTYFVTLCAHREFIGWAGGNPFGAAGAAGIRAAKMRSAKMPPEQPLERTAAVRDVMEKEMQKTARLLPWMKWGEWVIMPDHFHAIIRVEGGHGTLGDVMTGFKAGVTRTLRRGDILVAPNGKPAPTDMRIWHRNYYEVIVRSKEAEEKIAEYIRMNPWKLVQHATHEEQTFRMIGNPTLLNCEKIAVLCSRNAPPSILAAAEHRAEKAGAHCCFMSGFHSPPEKTLLAAFLQGEARLICCPAWGIDALHIPPVWLPALESNRMLILEMRNRDSDLAAAEQRNRFVLEQADQHWLPHVARGGMLDRILKECHTEKTRNAHV
jgi:putative transposase